MKLYNTLTRKTEDFLPLAPPQVGLYACGMTVYDYAHIGHGRKYVCDDVLRRILETAGYQVKHIQNVTDVGHLVSDADEGEDKLEKGAKRTGKTVWDVAQFFTDHFYRSMDQLNIKRPHVIARATDHIKDQISLITRLFEHRHAYDTPEAVYFDVTTFPKYGQLLGQKLEDKITAARTEVKTGEHKRHPADFVLWFKRVGRFADHVMHWDSPWGDGFPGWHIECSAMSMKYLGETIDIHTGGEDHISVHHPNEIAQSEGATGKTFVRFWVHYAFLTVDGRKMSKSLRNYYTLEDVINRGYDPLALRYLFLSAHYRKPQNFTWQSLDAAALGLKNLRSLAREGREEPASTAKRGEPASPTQREEPASPTQRGESDPSQNNPKRTILSPEKLAKIQALSSRFRVAVENDLQLPEALAVAWEVAKSNLPSPDKTDLLANFDQVLGLDLFKSDPKSQIKPPTKVKELASRREEARKNQDWEKADQLRQEMENLGWKVDDTAVGPTLKKL